MKADAPQASAFFNPLAWTKESEGANRTQPKSTKDNISRKHPWQTSRERSERADKSEEKTPTKLTKSPLREGEGADAEGVGGGGRGRRGAIGRGGNAHSHDCPPSSAEGA